MRKFWSTFFSLLLVTACVSAQSTSSSQLDKGTLPVMFDSVRAITRNEQVQVGWSNLTERDVNYYMIERSTNGQDFTPLYQLAPTSNLDDKASYTFVDRSPLAGSSFYRIRVYIITGKIVTSRILRVELGFKNPGFSFYPNPVTGDECIVSLASIEKGEYTIDIVNTAGLRIQRLVLNNQNEGLTQLIQLPSNMQPGLYVIQIKGEHYLSSKLFVKK